ncbi:Hypothetical small peptide [Latilactobacillus sakei subsp. sakei 23K]|uniref:Hypothetical small peptide n=1 Tax=Latilactobacillus sakei subsp. sakei (strain 23K) TaxID=314315 RepID=Q38XF1_LATSS|nr:Hypothetical small peptide [Latilactobacillus sakei subsp. sakei 23K]SOB37030.1 conserved hypothetical protein [Latilactobacillus sakei]SOB37508.1 conserved hypothetical protein [Latilactobacillus sakei]SON65046.1 conserved protein of unknown function [Latilactobacillus sakei]SON73112.1 conserved protein of unknown function [Latilactobacillus sakei]
MKKVAEEGGFFCGQKKQDLHNML